MKYELEGSTIYIARIKSNGLIANAKPCKYCLKFIMKHNITKICYTLNNNQYILINLQDIYNSHDYIFHEWTHSDINIGQTKQL